MKCEIDREVIIRIIETLKGIDVRGFDSMNRVVGLVIFFENLLNSSQTELGNEAK